MAKLSTLQAALITALILELLQSVRCILDEHLASLIDEYEAESAQARNPALDVVDCSTEASAAC